MISKTLDSYHFCYASLYIHMVGCCLTPPAIFYPCVIVNHRKITPLLRNENVLMDQKVCKVCGYVATQVFVNGHKERRYARNRSPRPY